MKLIRWAVLSSLTFTALACQPKPPVETPGPVAAPESLVKDLQTRYARISPDTRVGQVISVHSVQPLVAIGDVPVADFKEGDVITFLDANQEVIAHGTVVRTVGDAVHVRYTANEGGRAPIVGDIAIRSGGK